MGKLRNRIGLVESIKREYAIGMPDGMNEDFLKRLPVLFKRIEELEATLTPFARAYNNNKGFNVTMLDIYKSDCEQAFDMLDPSNSVKIEKKYEYPA